MDQQDSMPLDGRKDQARDLAESHPPSMSPIRASLYEAGTAQTTFLGSSSGVHARRRRRPR